MNAHPLKGGSMSALEFSLGLDTRTDFPSCCRRKRDIREFTPSTPSPTLGQPHPVATRGGMASGEAAEKKEIDRTVMGACGGGLSISAASAVFSGMSKKLGILYLYKSQRVGRTWNGNKRTNPVCVPWYPCTTIQSLPWRYQATSWDGSPCLQARSPNRHRFRRTD